MTELEGKNIDIEAIQLELEILKEEKEELLSQIRMGSELNENEAIHAMGEEEVRKQNNKLR